MAITTLPPPGERRNPRLGRITIGPRLRRELSARLLELAFEIAETTYYSERAPLEDKFAAIRDLLRGTQ